MLRDDLPFAKVLSMAMRINNNRRGRPNKYRQDAPITITNSGGFRLTRNSKAHELLSLIHSGAVSTPGDWNALGGRSYVLDTLLATGAIQIDGHGINTFDNDGEKAEVEETPEAKIETDETDSPEDSEEEQPEKTNWEEDGEFLPEWFDRAMRLAKFGNNIMLTGPSGSGKTYIAAKIAEKLDRSFAMQSCSEGMSESNLIGYLLPIGEDGAMEYAASPFVDAYENGGVFLLDEFDAADSNTAVFINAALAGQHFMIPQRYRNPLVRRHPDFVCIAATNTIDGRDANYSGRNRLDAATLDRFRTGVCDCYYDARVESNLCNGEVLAWGRAVREVIERNNLQHIMSTRTMIDATNQIAAGFSMSEIRESYFADWDASEVGLLPVIHRS